MEKVTIPAELTEIVAWFVQEVTTLSRTGAWSITVNGGPNTVHAETRTVRQGRDSEGRKVRQEIRTFHEFQVADR